MEMVIYKDTVEEFMKLPKNTQVDFLHRYTTIIRDEIVTVVLEDNKDEAEEDEETILKNLF